MPRYLQPEKVDQVAAEDSVRMCSVPEWIGETIVEYRLRRGVRGWVATPIHKTEKMRIHGHVRRINLTADRQSAYTRGKNIRHVARRSDRSCNRKNRSAERKLVYGTDVFTHIKDSVAASDGCTVVSKQIVGEANPRSPVGGVVVIHSGVAGATGQTGYAKFVDALWVDKRAGLLSHQGGNGIADVAQVVLGCAEQLPPQARIDGQVGSGLVIVLEEHSVIINTIFVVGNAAAAEGESGLPEKKVLEVTAAVNARAGGIEWIGPGGEEKQFSVKRLRKVFIQRHAIILAAKAEKMLAGRVAARVQERQVVLQLALVSSGRGAEIKRGKGKFINCLVEVAVGPVNPQIIDSHNGLVNGFVVDADVAYARLVHQARTEDVSLGHAQKTVMHRQIQGKVHVRDI